MPPSSALRSLLLSALLLTSSAFAAITIKGSKFFNEDGSQFFMKGIAYQRDPFDPFTNATQCELDANLMATLGTNLIRSYRVDPTKDHTECMQIFADKGIYVMIDLENPTYNIMILEANPEWNWDDLSFGMAVIDAFAEYDNLFGFFASNEIVTKPDGAPAAPYVKASVRDLKAYIKEKNYRAIPVGYAAADIATIRPMLQNYLGCEPADAAIDFFGVNIYEWCYGPEINFKTSGYSDRVDELKDLPFPSFFSEMGCNVVRPRTFVDFASILGPDMQSVLSGAIVYEWIQEANNYGIINYGPNNETVGVPTPHEPDFSNLKSAWAMAKPTGPKKADYTPTNKELACPAATEGTWPLDGDAALPSTPPKETGDAPWVGSVRAVVRPGETAAPQTRTNSGSPTGSATNSAGAGTITGSGTATASTTPSATKNAAPALAAKGGTMWAAIVLPVLMGSLTLGMMCL